MCIRRIRIFSLSGEESDFKSSSSEVIEAADADDVYEFSPELDEVASTDDDDSVVEDALTRR